MQLQFQCLQWCCNFCQDHTFQPQEPNLEPWHYHYEQDDNDEHGDWGDNDDVDLWSWWQQRQGWYRKNYYDDNDEDDGEEDADDKTMITEWLGWPFSWERQRWGGACGQWLR